MTLRVNIYQSRLNRADACREQVTKSHSEKVLNIPEHTLNTYPDAYGDNFYGNFHR